MQLDPTSGVGDPRERIVRSEVFNRPGTPEVPTLAEIDPGMKIMFITGFAAVALNPVNRAPEDAKILSKPFHLRDLVQEVERMVAA